jgi:hypothetical protein
MKVLNLNTYYISYRYNNDNTSRDYESDIIEANSITELTSKLKAIELEGGTIELIRRERELENK